MTVLLLHALLRAIWQLLGVPAAFQDHDPHKDTSSTVLTFIP